MLSGKTAGFGNLIDPLAQGPAVVIPSAGIKQDLPVTGDPLGVNLPEEPTDRSPHPRAGIQLIHIDASQIQMTQLFKYGAQVVLCVGQVGKKGSDKDIDGDISLFGFFKDLEAGVTGGTERLNPAPQVFIKGGDRHAYLHTRLTLQEVKIPDDQLAFGQNTNGESCLHQNAKAAPGQLPLLFQGLVGVANGAEKHLPRWFSTNLPLEDF